MKTFHSVAKFHTGADEKHEINFRWPKLKKLLINANTIVLHPDVDFKSLLRLL